MRYAEKYFVIFIRTYLGAFNLASGLNYFVRFHPQPVPADQLSASYVEITVQMGLFQMAKVIEVIAGACLLLNVFVPFALIALFPVTVTVLVMNAFHSPLAHIVVSGTRNFVFHMLLFAAYARHYFPLLIPLNDIRPIWRRGSTASVSSDASTGAARPEATLRAGE